jgi:integrase
MGYLRKPVQVEMPRNPFQMGRVLSPDEVRRILAVADLREQAIIMLLLDTGLRRSEACSLTWADLEDHTIRLRSGKGGRGRIVFVGDHTLAALEAIRGEGPILGLKPEGLRTMLTRLSRRSGVPQVTCHAFRRSFATSMIRAGVPLLHVQRMMGHRTLAMILRYAQVSGDYLAESHKRAGVVDRL